MDVSDNAAEASKKMLRVPLKTVVAQGGESVSCDVAMDATVLDLKVALSGKRESWQPPSRLRVCCNGAVLSDTDMVAGPIASYLEGGDERFLVLVAMPPTSVAAPASPAPSPSPAPAVVAPTAAAAPAESSTAPAGLSELAMAPISALSTLLRLADNILAAPSDPKYRALRRTNKMIQAKVLRHSRGEAWLASLGFAADRAADAGEELVSTITADALRPIRAALAAACDAVRPSRICTAHGWVVHGVAIEMRDRSRRGAFLENDGSRIDLSDDEALRRRDGRWHPPMGADERIVGVRGRQSSMGYLCGSLTLLLSTAPHAPPREVQVVGENSSVYGEAFEFTVPDDDDFADLRFADGRCLGLVLRSDAARAAARAAARPAPTVPPAAAGPSGAANARPSAAATVPPRVLHSVAQLLRWCAADATEPLAARPPTAPSAPLPKRPRVLHCHDCRGGYNQTADGDYLGCFGGWGAIDVFVYFGHHRVSMPPRVWVEACHARGVPCLGTLIVEGGMGVPDLLALLAPDAIDTAVDRLCALCEHFGFDGFLLNLEAPAAQMAAVHEFLATLTICLKQRIGEQALVLVRMRRAAGVCGAWWRRMLACAAHAGVCGA